MPSFIPILIRFDSLPSTNTEAAIQAKQGAPEGLCVVASEQTAGRGRLQRLWSSPKGAGLYFSIILRPKLEQRYWPLVTFTAAIAVHDALLEVCGIEADIKWPNDVEVDGRKICGILGETVDTELGRAVIVGIGINLTSDAFPEEIAATATSIVAATGKAPDKEEVLESVLRVFEARYSTLQEPDGKEEILRGWSQRSSYSFGRRICIADNGEIVQGYIQGFDIDGALLLETDKGGIRTVHAGDVTVVKE